MLDNYKTFDSFKKPVTYTWNLKAFPEDAFMFYAMINLL